MLNNYLKIISFVFIFMIFAVAIGCSTNRQVIHSVPLCDCEPGAETTWHRHEYDIIVVPLSTGELLIETETGEKISKLVCGESYARAKGVKHNVINYNDYELVFVEIELK